MPVLAGFIGVGVGRPHELLVGTAEYTHPCLPPAAQESQTSLHGLIMERSGRSRQVVMYVRFGVLNTELTALMSVGAASEGSPSSSRSSRQPAATVCWFRRRAVDPRPQQIRRPAVAAVAA